MFARKLVLILKRKQTKMTVSKSLFKLTFFFILIFGIHSCSNDELILDSEKPNHEKLSLDKFKQEILSKLAPKDPVLNNLQKGNKHQSSSRNSSLSIELIDSEILKTISLNELETYVIPVSTNDSDSRPHYYQLILITQKDKWDYKLLKFLPTVTNTKNDKRSKYEGTIEVIPFSSSQISNREDACQAYIVESEVYIPCIRHTGYHPDCWGGTWETRFDIVIECGSGTGGGGDPFIGGGGGSSYEGDTTGTSTYGGGSWTASPTSPTQTVYTGPIPVYYDTEAESQKLYERFLYGADLSSQQKDYLSQHKDVSDAVKNYLYINKYSNEAKEFSKQLIDYCIANPNTLNNSNDIINKYLDILLSINSTESFKNNQKLNCVFEKVKNTKGMNYYLKNFDNKFSTTNLIFDASTSVSSNAYANTTPPINNNIKITFNTNALNRPILDIARTFMHETIHAEIFRKLLSLAPNNGQIDVQLLNTMLTQHNYPGLYDYYTRFGINGMQHEQMAAHYREIIVNFLKEIDPSLSEEQYKAMAWVGLQDTTTWDELSDSEKLNIENTYLNWYNNANQNCQ